MGITIDNVHLPDHIERGAMIGPRFNTSLVTLATGAEEANIEWPQARIEVDAAYGIMKDYDPNEPDLAENGFRAIMAFFNARMGRAHGFLFKDWSDFTASNEPLYTIPNDPDGRLQLVKMYGGRYRRKITRPRVGTIILFSEGIELDPSDWDHDGRGKIVFEGTPPPQLRASFKFDVPVRFDTDVLQVNLTWVRAGEIPNVPLIEVWE